jgi:hypothetical protein
LLLQWQPQRQPPLLLLLAAVGLAVWQQQQQPVEVCWLVCRQQRGCLAGGGSELKLCQHHSVRCSLHFVMAGTEEISPTECQFCSSNAAGAQAIDAADKLLSACFF